MDERILNSLSKLGPEEFLGLMRFLNIPLMDGEEPRNFDLMLNDFIEILKTLSRRQKRTLLALLKR